MPGDERKRLTLFDGSNYIFRAYHAIRTELATSKGVPTRAVLGFTRMLIKSLREVDGTHVAVVWDRGGRAVRQKIDPQYKANRSAMPDDLVQQVPYIRQVVDALAVPSVEKEGWEADDVIATLARRGVEQGFDVVIVTGDKDFSQLVSERVKLYDGMQDRWTGPDEVLAKWGVPVEKFRELQALLGDAIDNIPGVPGVGEKTAAELIAAYGSLEAVIEAADSGQLKKKKVAEGIVALREQILRNRELVHLHDDLELGLEPADLARRTPDPAPVQQLFRELEFYTLLRELPAIIPALKGEGPAAPPPPPPPRAAPEVVPFEPPPTEVITTAEELERLLARLESAPLLGLRASPPGERCVGGRVAGLALAIPGGPSAYLSLDHDGLMGARRLDRGRAVPALRKALEGKRWVGIGTKRDVTLLAGFGLALPQPAGDAELAAYLLNPVRRTFEITDLAREKLACEIVEYGALAGVGKDRKPFAELDPADAGPWLGRCAAAAVEIESRLRADLAEQGLLPVYDELELPLVPVLAAMEIAGIRVDVKHLQDLGRELDVELARHLADVFAAAGREFNVASPKQLGQVLFEELKLPAGRKTKSGRSTDHEVLEKLAQDHPIARSILEHRQLSKLKGTYVEALPELVGADGRIHTTFDQSNTATGRLASIDPNLMNIPIRTDTGRRIREAFLPEEGWELVSADYSQIELRILAHVSADPGLVDALRSGADVHARTAAEVFGVEESLVSSEQRRIAKMINYAVAYGLSSYGLSTRLDIPAGDAAAIIRRYFERYAGVRGFIDRLLDEARRTGFVATLSGRRRFLPDLHSRNPALRQAAERAAINMPIQGTAADIMKRAMIGVHRRLLREALRARLLLQVHDELVFECPADEMPSLVALAREEMQGAASLQVPLVVDVGHGRSWADAH